MLRLSLDESNPGFARDGFGRQSMSEKRHAQLDARNTDTYQRTKKAREDKDRHQQELDDEYLPSQGTNPGNKQVRIGSNIVEICDVCFSRSMIMKMHFYLHVL